MLKIHHVIYVTETGVEEVVLDLIIKQSEVNSTISKLEQDYKTQPVIVHLCAQIIDNPKQPKNEEAS
jgi:hypothetical protein